jgi:hypothetical protein
VTLVYFFVVVNENMFEQNMSEIFCQCPCGVTQMFVSSPLGHMRLARACAALVGCCVMFPVTRLFPPNDM